MVQTKVLSVKLWAALLILLFLGTTITYSTGNSPSKSDDKKTFLIKLTHTPEQCLAALDQITKDDVKLLDKINWGCMSGDHTGYMIVQSKDEKSALEMLPSSVRNQAKVEKVDKFTKEQIESFHKMHD